MSCLLLQGSFRPLSLALYYPEWVVSCTFSHFCVYWPGPYLGFRLKVPTVFSWLMVADISLVPICDVDIWRELPLFFCRTGSPPITTGQNIFPWCTQPEGYCLEDFLPSFSIWFQGVLINSRKPSMCKSCKGLYSWASRHPVLLITWFIFKVYYPWWTSGWAILLPRSIHLSC